MQTSCLKMETRPITWTRYLVIFRIFAPRIARTPYEHIPLVSDLTSRDTFLTTVGMDPGEKNASYAYSKIQEEWFFFDFVGKFSSTCSLQSTRCTCGSPLTAYVNHFGCCAGSYAAIGNFTTSNPPPLFAACNVAVPGVCSTSGAAVLQVSSFTVLHRCLVCHEAAAELKRQYYYI